MKDPVERSRVVRALGRFTEGRMKGHGPAAPICVEQNGHI